MELYIGAYIYGAIHGGIHIWFSYMVVFICGANICWSIHIETYIYGTIHGGLHIWGYTGVTTYMGVYRGSTYGGGCIVTVELLLEVAVNRVLDNGVILPAASSGAGGGVASCGRVFCI